MQIKQFTDDKYVALNDLSQLGEDVIGATVKYRQAFLEVVSLNGLDFVNIIETPTLIKKRYIANIKLKGFVDIEAQNEDIILELAKKIVLHKKVNGIDEQLRKEIIKKYENNKKDLTIITNYLANNIEKLIDAETREKKSRIILPYLSKNDMNFIKAHHNIRLQYTIGDYISVNSCSYETGRTSLAKMVENGLYEKKKLGKKYVYQPTIKLHSIVKGVE